MINGRAQTIRRGSIGDAQLAPSVRNQLRSLRPARARVIASCQPDEFIAATGSGESASYRLGHAGWWLSGSGTLTAETGAGNVEHGVQSLKLANTADSQTIYTFWKPQQSALPGYPFGQAKPPTLQHCIALRIKVENISSIESVALSLCDPYDTGLDSRQYTTLISRTETGGPGMRYGIQEATWQWVILPCTVFSSASAAAGNVAWPWGMAVSYAASSSVDGGVTTIVNRRAIFKPEHVGEYLIVASVAYLITAVGGTYDPLTDGYYSVSVQGTPTVSAGTSIRLLVPFPDFPLGQIYFTLTSRTVGNDYTAAPALYISRIVSLENEKAIICLQCDEPYLRGMKYLEEQIGALAPPSVWPIDIAVCQQEVGGCEPGEKVYDDSPTAYGITIASPAQNDIYNITATDADTEESYQISYTAGATPTALSVCTGLLAAAVVARNAGYAPWTRLAAFIQYDSDGSPTLIIEGIDTDLDWSASVTKTGTGTIAAAEWRLVFPNESQIQAWEAAGHGICHHGNGHVNTPLYQSGGAVTCSTSADGKTVTASSAFFSNPYRYGGTSHAKRKIVIAGISPGEAIIDQVTSTTTATLKSAVQGSQSGKNFVVYASTDTLDWEHNQSLLRSRGVCGGKLIPTVYPQNAAIAYDSAGAPVESLAIVQRNCPMASGTVYSTRWKTTSWTWADFNCALPYHPYAVRRYALSALDKTSFTGRSSGVSMQDQVRFVRDMKMIGIFYAHDIMPTPTTSNIAIALADSLIAYLWHGYLAGLIDFATFLDLFYLWGATSEEYGPDLNGLLQVNA